MLVTTEAALAAAVRELASERRVAVDLESNGLFAYRARVCIVQLAARGRVFIVDALATSLAPLGPLLADEAVAKVVHDVAFDARLLGEAGLTLANVEDTSIAARMLGRTATGLAALLGSELGLTIDKKMQQHDWAERPLDDKGLTYLADDVVHLEPLAAKLFAEVEAKNIGAEVREETRYRLAQSAAGAGTSDPRPPYLRLKGIDKVPEPELRILRRLAELRETKARALDVPPYKVLGPDVLFAIAHAKPKTMTELAKIRGATQGRRARSLASDVLRAVAAAATDTGLPPEDVARLTRREAPPGAARARRAREQRLTKWRRAEAARRGVDEQVVLPGHCLQEIADVSEPSLEAIAAVPGIGAFRTARDGAALLAVLAGSSGDSPAASHEPEAS